MYFGRGGLFMHKSCKFILAAFTLSLCFGNGALLLNKEKNVQKADAAIDAMTIDEGKYLQYSSDPSSTSFYRYQQNSGNYISNTFGISQSLVTNSASSYTYTLEIGSSYDGFYYFTTIMHITLTQAAYSHGNYNVTFIATSNNSCTKQSDHALEVFALNNYYGVGSFPSQTTFGSLVYNQDDYSTASSDALFRASGRGGGIAYQNNTSNPKSYEVENKYNDDQPYFLYFVISGYREQSSGNDGYTATVNIQISQTTNIGYGVYNSSESRYHDTLSGALDYINNSASNRTSHTLLLLKDLSETAAGKEMKTGVILDLQGHNFTYTGAATSAYMIIRQANGLKGSREFKFLSTGGNGKISGNFNDSVLLLGGEYGTYGVNTYIGPGVTIENTGGGKAIASHQSSKLEIAQGATLISNNSFGLYLNISLQSLTEIAGTIISRSTYALQIQSVTDSGYINLGGSAVSLQSYGSLASIYSNCTPTEAKIVASCTVANVTTAYTASADPISITFASTPSNGTAIIYSLNANALANFSVTNEANKYHLEYNSSSSYAYFAINKYNVSFNANGGTGSMSVRSIEHGTAFVLPANSFTAPSYRTFLKWNTKADGSGTSKNVDETYTITFDIIFYAIWYQTDANIYNEFRLEYLKMESYNQDLGYCLDGDSHHYFLDASNYFQTHMSSAQRLYFAQNYSDEWARFNAWAAANGKTIELDVSGEYILRSAKILPATLDEGINIAYIIVIGAFALSLSILPVLLKRKHKKY